MRASLTDALLYRRPSVYDHFVDACVEFNVSTVIPTIVRVLADLSAGRHHRQWRGADHAQAERRHSAPDERFSGPRQGGRRSEDIRQNEREPAVQASP